MLSNLYFVELSFRIGYMMPSVLFVVSTIIVGITIYMTIKGTISPKIRRLPAIDAIDEAVGRCAEMGKPLHYCPGIGGIGNRDTIPGLAIGAYVARKCAELGVRFIFTFRNAQIQPIAMDMIREAYTMEGKSEEFNPDDIIWLSPRQFAFATGLVGLLSRERPGASLLLGSYAAESLICTEAGFRAGAVQIAGCTNSYQIPYFATTCDYVLISEELQTAGVYISQIPEQVGTILGQDYVRLLILALMGLGAVLYAMGFTGLSDLLQL
jgi:hypothetical protein